MSVSDDETTSSGEDEADTLRDLADKIRMLAADYMGTPIAERLRGFAAELEKLAEGPSA
jgi:hypothetical protein